MLKFLLQITMVVSLGFVVYLFGRVVPRVSDEDIAKAKEQSLFHWLVGYLERVDDWLLWLFEKLLRRVRVGILKLDNIISKKLSAFRKESERQTGFPAEMKKEGEEKKEE
jgi:hypothetical protein